MENLFERGKNRASDVTAQKVARTMSELKVKVNKIESSCGSLISKEMESFFEFLHAVN